MSKLLSIIIPTYNMEALLPRCLDSLLAPNALDRIEAIVVNDGSKDGSLTVANEYKRRFPESVTVIDKPNGNYGSTINAALPAALGKYVKILDSDDWFDSDALVKFLDELQNVDSDMVVTHFTNINENGRKEVTKYNVYGKEPYEYGHVYPLDDVLKDGYIRFFLMHALTYRTDMLKTMGYKQTEGISYTDTEWASYPVFVAGSIVFFDINLYQYNLAREGQTMDPKVLLKSVSQIEKVTASLVSFYINFDKSRLSPVRKKFLNQYYLNRLRLVCKIHLFDMPRENFDKSHFHDLDACYSEICSQLGLGSIRLYPENKIVRIDAMKHWHKTGNRWPAWFESFNHIVDCIMTFLFVKLFK